MVVAQVVYFAATLACDAPKFTCISNRQAQKVSKARFGAVQVGGVAGGRVLPDFQAPWCVNCRESGLSMTRHLPCSEYPAAAPPLRLLKRGTGMLALACVLSLLLSPIP